jgi:hypothetical protein
MSLLSKCVFLTDEVLGTQTPGLDTCGDTCLELAVEFSLENPELAGMIALGCIVPCVEAVEGANRGEDSFADLFCRQIIGQNTSDWCDNGAGAGPDGSVSFYVNGGAGPSLATKPCDGHVHAIEASGQDIWWKCSGSSTLGHTRAAADPGGVFGLLMTQEPKVGPLNPKTTCRLNWTFQSENDAAPRR